MYRRAESEFVCSSVCRKEKFHDKQKRNKKSYTLHSIVVAYSLTSHFALAVTFESATQTGSSFPFLTNAKSIKHF